MNWIEPKRLASGMTIGIMAPASASDEDLHKNRRNLCLKRL